MHSEMQRYPEHIKKIHNGVVESTLRLLSQYFETLQEQGILRKFNTELAARAFLGMFFSYFYVKELKCCLLKESQASLTEPLCCHLLKPFYL